MHLELQFFYEEFISLLDKSHITLDRTGKNKKDVWNQSEVRVRQSTVNGTAYFFQASNYVS
jgi:hypothetical protein